MSRATRRISHLAPSARCAVLCFSVLVSSQLASGAWTTNQGDAGHTGYVPVSIDVSATQVAWQRTLDGKLNPLAIADGRVFASQLSNNSDPTRKVMALDAANGNTIWTASPANSRLAPPAYANGTVYVQNTSTNTSIITPYLTGFNATTGAVVTQTQYTQQGGELYNAPTPFQGNIHFAGGTFGGLYSANGTTGTTNWFQSNLPQPFGWSPAVNSSFAYGYLSDSSHTKGLYAINRTSGAIAYVIPDPYLPPGWGTNYADVGTTATLGSQQDAFAISFGRLVKFNLASPSIAWVLPNTPTTFAVGKGNVFAAVNADIWGVGTRLDALSEASGQLLWSWTPPSESILSNIVVTDTDLFFATATKIYGIDLLTHQMAWSTNIATNLDAELRLALSDGRLYFSNVDKHAGATTITAYSLAIVPEPSGLLLATLGLSLVIGRRAIRRRSASATR
jgi:hypothetical protein